MISDSFRVWFDRFGLAAGVLGLALGALDRAQNRPGHGTHLLVIGGLALTLALGSIVRRRLR